MIRIEITPPGEPPFVYVMDRDELVVGRSQSCDITVRDGYLSRNHARLSRRGTELWVEDLGSSNGTLVNDARIVGASPVSPGDTVRISGTTLRVLPSGAEEARDEPLSVTMLRPFRELLPAERTPAAVAADEGGALHRYAARLRLLNELHRSLSGPVELESLLEQVLDGAFEHLHPEEAAILLRDPGGELRLAAGRSSGSQHSPLTSRTLVREVVERGQGAIVLDSHQDQRFAGAQSLLISAPRSILAVPLLDESGTLGMLAVSAKLTARLYDEEDLELLASLGSVAAMRIRNLVLAGFAKERERLATELELARKLQLSLLPKELPEIRGWEIFGLNVPSGVVSGDYYQVAARGEGAECVVTVADVCGKGMGAALLTASLEAVAAAFVEAGEGPRNIFTQANRFLYGRTPPDKYATGVLALLRAGRGEVEYVNAGHVPPLVLRSSGAIEELTATGFPIGLLPEGEYQSGSIELEPGDLMVLYTDGITEAESFAGDELGEQRLRAVLSPVRSLALTEIAARVQRALDEFVGEGPITDDRTLVLVRRAG